MFTSINNEENLRQAAIKGDIFTARKLLGEGTDINSADTVEV